MKLLPAVQSVNHRQRCRVLLIKELDTAELVVVVT